MMHFENLRIILFTGISILIEVNSKQSRAIIRSKFKTETVLSDMPELGRAASVRSRSFELEGVKESTNHGFVRNSKLHKRSQLGAFEGILRKKARILRKKANKSSIQLFHIKMPTFQTLIIEHKIRYSNESSDFDPKQVQLWSQGKMVCKLKSKKGKEFFFTFKSWHGFQEFPPQCDVFISTNSSERKYFEELENQKNEVCHRNKIFYRIVIVIFRQILLTLL